MSKEDVLASDIVSVGSCDSLIRDELDGTFEGLEAMSIYTNTHAGGCLELVLRGLMDEGEINVEQRLVLLNEFNRKYHDAFSQCNSRLRLSIHGNLAEYSSIEKGSVFEVKVWNFVHPAYNFA
jgi:hypothetical protein